MVSLGKGGAVGNAAVARCAAPRGRGVLTEGNRMMIAKQQHSRHWRLPWLGAKLLGSLRCNLHNLALMSAVLGIVLATTSGPVLAEPFASFVAKVELKMGPMLSDDVFEVKATFELGEGSNGIDPLTEAVSVQVGSLLITIPAGSFESEKSGEFKFDGEIDGVVVEVVLRAKDEGSYRFKAEGKGADLTGSTIPLEVSLTVGDDSGGTTLFHAEFK
jgi:hypothetical protein